MSPQSRREFALRALGLTGGALFLAACGSIGGGKGTSDTSGDSGTGDSGTGDSSGVAWATGGTAVMASSYADPFADETDTTCSLTCEMTLGPCYAETLERQDISEGYDGLPVWLCIRVVDDACTVVAGATVDVWHAAPSGLYSGEDASDMCTNGDADAVSHRFFRGTQTSDANGIVRFKTCFPGWYSSRAIHIHFQVRRGSSAYTTAQLFFEQSLIQEIYAAEPIYVDRGQPDTANDDDKVLGDNDRTMYVAATSKASDGVMIAWKDVVIRASLSEDTCSAPESSR